MISMIKSYEIYGGETKVEYNYSEAGNELILRKIIDWLAEHNVSSGESAVGKDECQIDAIELIAQIADDILELRTVNDEDDDY